MNLQIKPASKNIYPLEGILIKGNEIYNWIKDFQILKIDLLTTLTFAVPDIYPNSIWGCFVMLNNPLNEEIKLKNIQYCQTIQSRIFMPENSVIFPVLKINEVESLFSKNPVILHPEFGLFELESPIDWNSHLKLPRESNSTVKRPIETPFIPKSIHSLEVKALAPEESIEKMEAELFPKKEEFKDAPLSLNEKIKYHSLKQLFKNTKDETSDEEKSLFLKAFENILKKFKKDVETYVEKLKDDFEVLEQRNSSEMEKLMKLFKSNPKEALKYAIPIDNKGTTRGSQNGTFKMSKRWSNFDLFGLEKLLGSGIAMLQDESMAQLQQQYNQAAIMFINEKEYSKAAFIYLKLLSNSHMAAKTLEDGQLYSEAASIYLKYLKNKEKAASCYEKGRMTTEAINLYKELNNNEKVGDLYISIYDKNRAFDFYNLVVEDYKNKNQFVKASVLLKNKMNDKSSAQEILLEGWENDTDAFNSINNYFTNIEDHSNLSFEIENIYKNYTSVSNKPTFLKALKYEYKKNEKIAEQTKIIAYQIVSELASSQPSIVNEIAAFVKDSQIAKDITRFKTLKNNLL